MTEAFFTLHRDLPREGPGQAADVLWALAQAGTPARARICDVACGPGADTVTLAGARPEAQIFALDGTAHFVAEAQVRTARFGARVQVVQGDMARLAGAYDLIWCAGAAYFMGVTEALAAWRAALAPGGRVAFSEPVYLSEPPTPCARAFWQDEYPGITALAGIETRITAAGFRVLGHRMVVGAPWADYLAPLESRIAALRAAGPEAKLKAVLDAQACEIARWRACPDDIAYALCVVAPQ
jgi:trans-aconitate methyltransferase